MSQNNKSTTQDKADLTRLGERTLDQLTQAIEMEEAALAIQLANRMSDEFQGMHDHYLNWTTKFMGFIGKTYGEDVLAKAIEETMATSTAESEDIAVAWAAMSDEERIQLFAKGVRGHLQPFKVREKEDSYELVLDQCGSGGRLIRQGAYDGENALYKIKEPTPMTYGQRDFPVYCAHCHFEGKAVGKKTFYEVIASDKPGTVPCLLRVYKRDK